MMYIARALKMGYLNRKIATVCLKTKILLSGHASLAQITKTNVFGLIASQLATMWILIKETRVMDFKFKLYA